MIQYLQLKIKEITHFEPDWKTSCMVKEERMKKDRQRLRGQNKTETKENGK